MLCFSVVHSIIECDILIFILFGCRVPDSVNSIGELGGRALVLSIS